MKIDKNDLIFGAIVGGLVICSPFIAIYHAGKWIYSKTPKGIKERKAEEKKREKMNREIHELEKQLGLAERDDSYMNYDPLYIGNKHRGREGYLADLKKKVASGYKSLDLILMIKETKGGICAPRFGYGDCRVLLLLHKDCYNIQDCAPAEKYSLEYIRINVEEQGELPRADRYVEATYSRMRHIVDYAVRLQTLSECGNYQDYYVYAVPGKFQFSEVEAGTDGQLNEFIADFKRKYKKEENNE